MPRHPKPVQLQLLEGNKGRKSKEKLDKMVEAEKALQFEKGKLKPPSWLCGDAKKLFKKMVKDFEATQLLVNVDAYALSMFVDAYMDYVRYTEIISVEGDMVEHTNKSGATNETPHPLITKKAQAFQQMDKMMGKFGLTPVDRAKLVQAMVSNEDDEDNKFGDRI